MTTINAEQANNLYAQVVSMTQDWQVIDEIKAQLIVEYAKDALDGFGSTNQVKKVELRRIIQEAEQIISPDSIESFRKRVERVFLKTLYPRKPILRKSILVGTGIVSLIILLFTFFKTLEFPKSSETNNSSNVATTVVEDKEPQGQYHPQSTSDQNNQPSRVVTDLPNKAPVVAKPSNAQGQARVFIKRARSYYSRAQYQNALRELNRALRAEPNNQEALSLKKQISNTLEILNQKQ